ncbi:hypothetical protein OSB04_009194 [Centaurea solstitialis]|uniref:TIR domain-containing protein n=1 Tax=Centaurea solstitialis TaxID=347529 RepID=A0AA38WTL3_9ASTR|nr:hypothetical protein OSB04_009194 [Centaurea solstitialis]
MACSSIGDNKSFKYNVFLSFRGEDIRKTFIDHLYEALKQHGIYTYKDDERIQKGTRIKDDLLESIQESKFFVIVFSKNYASSAWCLDELVKIMECHNTTHQTAFPVFYHVDPTEVRHQTGEFGEAFAIHNNKKEKEAAKWREALLQAGNLAGWVLENTVDGHEAKFIKEIVGLLSLKLRSINVYVDRKLVGMKPRMTKVLSSLETGIENVGMIGIKGIGGGGKTTLARAVFDQISTQFEGKSFVENVSKVTREAGLQSLQEQILSDVLNDQSIIVRSVHNGKGLMKNMLSGRKVLIVLDNVDHICQLEALAGEHNWFKAGSRIIITTRDEQVLITHKVAPIHDVDLLSSEEAICLFSRYAFGTETPAQEYRFLSTQVVRYAAGLPLMIRVLGALLCGKKEDEWTDQLESLKTRPLQEPMDILRLSYINLEGYLQEIFLDVACFLKSWHKDDVVRVLESCGFNAKIGLKLLEEKSLITISDDQYLGMHDLIQEMGRDIVRHLHPDDPEQHSRLWILNEIEDILANDLGTDKTRAIAVDDNHVELSSEIVTKGFNNMNKIRFLRVISKTEDDYSCCDEKTDQVSQTLPYSLRYLSWGFYPHSSLPTTFRANNLVALEMSDCRIHQLWEGKENKVLSKLRFLVLSFSKLRTLDLGLTPYLEKLDLEGCDDLEVLQTPVGCLKRLIFLNLNGCLKINSFVFIKQLESLKVLSLSRLYLKEFPDIIPGHCNSSLLELQFRHNDVQKLPASIGNLQKLLYLDLHSCRKLVRLPGSICGLRHLRNLKLYGCMLEELPKDFGRLVSLEKLNMSYTSIKHLPHSICKLKHLKTLKLSFCRNLEKLPGDLGKLGCLEKLILTECTQVKDIPDSICRLKHLKSLILLDCIQLEKLPKELGVPGCLEVLNVKGTRIRHLPTSISSLEGLKLIQAKSVLQSRGYASTLKASSSTRIRMIEY